MNKYINYALSIALASFFTDKIMKFLNKEDK